MLHVPLSFFFFFFNDTATTEIYTLSLHDALPISPPASAWSAEGSNCRVCSAHHESQETFGTLNTATRNSHGDRKSTRLNSSHLVISYAVFCLKKKKKHTHDYA